LIRINDSESVKVHVNMAFINISLNYTPSTSRKLPAHYQKWWFSMIMNILILYLTEIPN